VSGGNVTAVDDEGDAEDRSRPSRALLTATRVWLPLAIAIAGVVLIVIGHGRYSDLANSASLESAVGVSLLLVALIVWMINWMFRLSVESNREREVEERAREYFDRTGHWPDEDEP
jgi:protein-S-isoprenylcysteine O-methyltransferase Ste14